MNGHEDGGQVRQATGHPRWILALALAAAGALYWVKSSRRYTSLVWFNSLVLLLYLGIHAFSTRALQEPIEQTIRHLR